MKRVLVIFPALALACSVFGAANDLLLTFSTPGPDKYADGSTVRDGECYALVYTPAGRTFAGFTADGKEIDPATGRIVLCAPVARNGRCPMVAFQVDAAAVAANYTNGSWSVHLLDTRRFGEGGAVSLSGTRDGRPRKVNASGVVSSGSVSVKSGETLNPLGGVLPAMGPSAASETSQEPENTPRPRITGVKVLDGMAYVTVRDTVSCLDYVLKEGEKPSELSVPDVHDRRSGVDGGEIILVSPAKNSSGFFTVGRE